MTSQSFGPAVTKESQAWSSSFALEPAIVEAAFVGYLAMHKVPLTDDDAASALAKLRRDIGKIINSPGEAPSRAAGLDEVVARLDSSIGRAQMIGSAGLGGDVPDLQLRLEAARSLVIAVRAAIARRGRAGK